MSDARERILAALNELFDMPVASRFGYESAVIDAIAIVERELPKTDRVAVLEAENASLREALLEAADSVDEYAQYAGDYLREKHGVDDDIARFKTLAGGE